MKYVLVLGNPVTGFSFVGPFDRGDDAAEYMYRTHYEGDWWIAVMTEPALLEQPHPNSTPLF